MDSSKHWEHRSSSEQVTALYSIYRGFLGTGRRTRRHIPLSLQYLLDAGCWDGVGWCHILVALAPALPVVADICSHDLCQNKGFREQCHNKQTSLTPPLD
jgi:hypothetical protein